MFASQSQIHVLKESKFYVINIKTGGNVGLFTGMSILSLFEIGFWLVRFILRSSGRKKKSKDADAMVKETRIFSQKQNL